MDLKTIFVRRAGKIFLLAVVVELLALILFISFLNHGNGERIALIQSLPVFGPDSEGYYQAAKNFLDYGQFSLSPAPPLLPISFRTPGYPSFVVLFWAIFGNLLAVTFVQIVLVAGTAVLVYRLACWCLNKRLAMVVASLTVLEPSAIYYSFLLLSDTLFTFLLVAGVYLFFGPIFSPVISRMVKWWYLASGLIIGLATLVRPIAQFLPFVFGLLILTFYLYTKQRRVLVSLILFLFGFGVVVMPWVIRNHYLFGGWAVSSVASYNLYHYNAPMFYAYKEGVSFEEGRAFFQSKVRAEEQLMMMSLYKSQELKTAALDYIQTDWLGYSFFHLVKSAPFFLTDGLRDISHQLGLADTAMPNISNFILHGDILGLGRTIFNSPRDSLFLVGGALFWLSVLAGMFLALGSVWFRGSNARGLIIFAVCLVFYFGFLTGPVANARFRLPAQPFMFLTAVYGFSALRLRFKSI